MGTHISAASRPRNPIMPLGQHSRRASDQIIRGFANRIVGSQLPRWISGCPSPIHDGQAAPYEPFGGDLPRFRIINEATYGVGSPNPDGSSQKACSELARVLGAIDKGRLDHLMKKPPPASCLSEALEKGLASASAEPYESPPLAGASPVFNERKRRADEPAGGDFKRMRMMALNPGAGRLPQEPEGSAIRDCEGGRMMELNLGADRLPQGPIGGDSMVEDELPDLVGEHEDSDPLYQESSGEEQAAGDDRRQFMQIEPEPIQQLVPPKPVRDLEEALAAMAIGDPSIMRIKSDDDLPESGASSASPLASPSASLDHSRDLDVLDASENERKRQADTELPRDRKRIKTTL